LLAKRSFDTKLPSEPASGSLTEARGQSWPVHAEPRQAGLASARYGPVHRPLAPAARGDSDARLAETNQKFNVETERAFGPGA
jgi:hypothetical protein